jgi:hypothetical protein
LVFIDPHFALLQENPAVNSPPQVQIGAEFIRFIVINGEGFPG